MIQGIAGLTGSIGHVNGDTVVQERLLCLNHFDAVDCIFKRRKLGREFTCLGVSVDIDGVAEGLLGTEP